MQEAKAVPWNWEGDRAGTGCGQPQRRVGPRKEENRNRLRGGFLVALSLRPHILASVYKKTDS